MHCDFVLHDPSALRPLSALLSIACGFFPAEEYAAAATRLKVVRDSGRSLVYADGKPIPPGWVLVVDLNAARTILLAGKRARAKSPRALQESGTNRRRPLRSRMIYARSARPRALHRPSRRGVFHVSIVVPIAGCSQHQQRATNVDVHLLQARVLSHRSAFEPKQAVNMHRKKNRRWRIAGPATSASTPTMALKCSKLPVRS